MPRFRSPLYNGNSLSPTSLQLLAAQNLLAESYTGSWAKFLSSGDGKTLFKFDYATGGTAWSSNTRVGFSSISGLGASFTAANACTCAASSVDKGIIVCGTETGAKTNIRYSANYGSSWSSFTAAVSNDEKAWGCAYHYGNGVWYVSQDSGMYSTSALGLGFSLVEAGAQRYQQILIRENPFLLVAIGSSGDPAFTGYYTYDGVTWTLRYAPFHTTTIGQGAYCPTWGKFFVVTDTSQIYWTRDGINWTALTVDATLPSLAIFENNGLLIRGDGYVTTDSLSSTVVDWVQALYLASTVVGCDAHAGNALGAFMLCDTDAEKVHKAARFIF